MPRGGRRSGAPGKSYQNRTDLNTGPRPLPVTTAPGQPYGDATAQAQGQAAVPMGDGPIDSQQGSPSHQDLMDQAGQYQPPNVIPLRSPSMRPGEHVMTPPVPPALPPSPLLTGVALLNSLGADASPEVKALRTIVNAGQQNQAAP